MEGFFSINDPLGPAPPGTVQLRLPFAQTNWESLLKHRLVYLTPKASESAGPGWGQRACFSNKFPGEAAGLGTAL